MKKTLSIILFALGFFTYNNSYCQGLQVTPPSANTNKVVAIPHALYPSNYFFNEPQVLSIDLNEAGDKVLKLEQIGDMNSISISEIQTEKKTLLKSSNAANVSQAYFLTDNFIALEIQNETNSFEIIEVSSGKVIATVASNTFIGSTTSTAYFCNQIGNTATIEKFDLQSNKVTQSSVLPGEVFGWYFSKTKGIVGVAIHNNMLSHIYSMENEKLGKSLIEFSSGYYFEAKGCNATGDVLYGITNFQSLTTYACAISKSGIKPINSKSGESCTDIFVCNNAIALTTNSINAAEYQESQSSPVQKIIAFAKEGFKGTSVNIIDCSSNSNTFLFCIQGETIKPKYFVWENNKAKPISFDKFDAKNPVFIASEVAQIQTGEVAPQTGRMYFPTKTGKAAYPLVIYIPKNIFLPYSNQFNPIVQQLCQSGYAVFVWNTRYAYRPKIGFAYSDLVGSLTEDIELLLASLTADYSLLKDNTFIIGEGLGGYIALNASVSNPEIFAGVVLNRLDFPSKEFGQDLLAARMFGEDAQTKLMTLDRMNLSQKSNYLSYQSTKSNIELRLTNSIKPNHIKWTEQASSKNRSVYITSNELSEITRWLQHLSQIEPRVIEDKPKVEVKTK
jgi:hypothetical protein